MRDISLHQQRTLACSRRAHCGTCRTDADWRERVTGVRHFRCPHGMDAPHWRRWLRIPKPGDTAHRLANLTLVGPAFRAWLKLTGSKCQCEKRRREWNEAGWLGLTKQLFKRK